MSNFSFFMKEMVEKVKSSPRPSPSILEIPRNHIDKNQNSELDYSFKRDQDYFQVIINEMYLTEARKLAVNIDPLVYCVSEFTYRGQAQTQVIPYLVGPSMLKEKGVPDKYTKGMIIKNTCVSGLHPYRGAGLTFSIILLEARQNAIRPLLNVIEKVSGALNFSPAIAPYMTVANVLMDGFELFFNAGGVEPIIGLRDSYGPNLKITFQPSYFALIDQPEVDPATLWVSNNQLMVGNSLNSAKNYREADFVLYSFMGPQENRRDDLEGLPFNELWTSVRTEAASPKDDPDFKNARLQMSTLYQVMLNSPDLTEPQAETLADQYFDKMQQIHKKAKKIGLQGAQVTDEEQARQDKIRARALEIAKVI
jgi:hypothetical protein